jgi:dihydrodipicolinate synthase/N-acetylneuraminate lyase
MPRFACHIGARKPHRNSNVGALKRRGIIDSDAVRSPLRRLTREEAAGLDAALKEVGL